jgi:hypothetical protein
MKTLAILALSVLASGCHTSYELSRYRYQVTDDFTDAEFTVMQAEVDHLCDVNDGRCISITRESHHNKIVKGELPEAAGDFWIKEDGSRQITLDEIVIDAGFLNRIFRHEMGHAAGCHGKNNYHLPEPGNVMYSKIYVVQPDVDWTEADLACINRELDWLHCNREPA